jgi:regulator of protease activity HflC (stomatin/prohibitin superfamily)
LRNLSKAEAAIARNADILLRKLVGSYPMPDLFQPAVRERLERQASHLLADRLKPLGLDFMRLNMQAIELPGEIAEAINKARALETLDGALRHLDPATLDVVRGVYQLDQVLHWDNYLPVPSRLTMNRLKHVTRR